jgi:hypothetical protein
VYFLGLNFVPCEDDPVSQQDTAEYEQLQQGEQHSPAEADDCTPFCQCHCCHIHVLNFGSDTSTIFEPAISTLIIQKGERLGEEIPRFHFQPPQF